MIVTIQHPKITSKMRLKCKHFVLYFCGYPGVLNYCIG